MNTWTQTQFPNTALARGSKETFPGHLNFTGLVALPFHAKNFNLPEAEDFQRILARQRNPGMKLLHTSTTSKGYEQEQPGNPHQRNEKEE